MPSDGGASFDSRLQRQAQWLDRYRPGLRVVEQGSVDDVLKIVTPDGHTFQYLVFHIDTKN